MLHMRPVAGTVDPADAAYLASVSDLKARAEQFVADFELRQPTIDNVESCREDQRMKTVVVASR